MRFVGKPIPRKEGRKKVTGAALYVDDLKFDGMLHGVTVRSSIPRGQIKNISFEGQRPTSEDHPSATAGGTDSGWPATAGGTDQPPATPTSRGTDPIPWDEFTIVMA